MHLTFLESHRFWTPLWVVLSLTTEMDNPPSNCKWDKTQLLSIESSKGTCVCTKCVSAVPAQSLTKSYRFQPTKRRCILLETQISLVSFDRQKIHFASCKIWSRILWCSRTTYKQLFKKWTSKFTFSIWSSFLILTPAIWRKDRPWKRSYFFVAYFFYERDGQPNFRFDIDSKVLFIYRLIPRKPNFFGRLAIFYTTPIGRFFGASRSVHGRIQHKGAVTWVSGDRYALHRGTCKIWRWVVYLGSEK
jgi:hypothetical protein